jgi:hypothetical protein
MCPIFLARSRNFRALSTAMRERPAANSEPVPVPVLVKVGDVLVPDRRQVPLSGDKHPVGDLGPGS